MTFWSNDLSGQSGQMTFSVNDLFSHTVIFFWAKLVRNGRIRAVEVRPQKFRAKFSQFGRISSIAQPKNLLIWGNFAQIERNSPENFGAKREK
jgi:hypothetical protein